MNELHCDPECLGPYFAFGEFRFLPDSGELLRAGRRVRLQPQPARLLELLVRRSRRVVTREEIRSHLWGSGTFVDFEHGLNYSIARIRRALGDSASDPRFVETLPRRGYRFRVEARFVSSGGPTEAALFADSSEALARAVLAARRASLLAAQVRFEEARRALDAVIALGPEPRRQRARHER